MFSWLNIFFFNGPWNLKQAFMFKTNFISCICSWNSKIISLIYFRSKSESEDIFGSSSRPVCITPQVKQTEVVFESSWPKQSQERTRVNPDRNIFWIKCGTNIYFIYSIEVWSIIITEFEMKIHCLWVNPVTFKVELVSKLINIFQDVSLYNINKKGWHMKREKIFFFWVKRFYGRCGPIWVKSRFFTDIYTTFT